MTDVDFEYSDSERVVSRHTPAEKRPPLVGWRTNALEQPHVRKQLIRRHSTRDSDLMRYLESFVYVSQKANKEEREAKKREEVARREFLNLSRKWRQNTAFTSSIPDIVLDQSYQRIIGMGTSVVPLILRSLEKNAEYWFWALEAITGEDPVPEKDKGRSKLMAKHWLDWAREKNLID